MKISVIYVLVSNIHFKFDLKKNQKVGEFQSMLISNPDTILGWVDQKTPTTFLGLQKPITISKCNQNAISLNTIYYTLSLTFGFKNYVGTLEHREIRRSIYTPPTMFMKPGCAIIQMPP